MNMAKCGMCKKKIENSSPHKINCLICSKYYHWKCVDPLKSVAISEPYYCYSCMSSALPFNHIQLNEDFQSVLDEMYSTAQLTVPLYELQSKIFNPFEMNENEYSPLYDTDPDLHCYSQEFAYHLQCNYYTEDMFNLEVKNSMKSTSSSLSLFHTNIRSVSQNLNNLTAFLGTLDYKFQIIALSETWLHEQNTELYNIAHYSKESSERKNRRGGGVALYVAESLRYSSRNDLNCQTDTLEGIFVELDKTCTNSDKNIVVGCIYRPPGTDLKLFIDQMVTKLEMIKKENKLCYLLGDFNVNLLNYETHYLTSNFVDTLFAYGYIPFINKPTRVGNRSATLIDNIFTNNFMDKESMSGIIYTDITDHFPVFHISNTHVFEEEECTRTKRVFSDKNVNEFNASLSNIEWNDILSLENPENSFSTFHKLYVEKFEKHFPEKTVPIKYRNKYEWITEGLKKSIKHKNKLFVHYKRTLTRSSHDAYLDYKRLLVNLVKEAEKQHYDQLFSKYKGNLAQTWKVMKDIINKNRRKQRASSTFIVNDTTITNDADIAGHFNNYFINIGASLDRKIPHTDSNPTDYITHKVTNTIFLEPVTMTEVAKIINNLKIVVQDGIIYLHI